MGGTRDIDIRIHRQVDDGDWNWQAHFIIDGERFTDLEKFLGEVRERVSAGCYEDDGRWFKLQEENAINAFHSARRMRPILERLTQILADPTETVAATWTNLRQLREEAARILGLHPRDGFTAKRVTTEGPSALDSERPTEPDQTTKGNQ